MKKQIIIVLALSLLTFLPFFSVKAMPVGTLLYRTSGGDKMYGFNSPDLIVAEKGKLAHIYSGHAAIYVGKENGVDYIVEMQPKGAIKVPAKYFINEAAGEKLVGAKLPEQATPLQIATAVAIAKNLALNNAAYDFDFKKQKGPNSGEWTCVGLTEKVYESSNINNPTNLKALEYDSNYYAVDITADGYDDFNIYNAAGDCFADSSEYSKISPKRNMLIPAPELLGYDVGLEKDGERYIFLPYTQAIQNTLKDVEVDINLSSSFPEPEVRGNSPLIGLILKWSLINNPVSSVKNLARKIEGSLLAIKEKVFPDNSVALADYSDVTNNESISNKVATTTSSAKKSTATKIVATKASTTKTSISKSSVGSTTNKTSNTVKATSSVTNLNQVSSGSSNVIDKSEIAKPTIPRTTIRPVATTTPSVATSTVKTIATTTTTTPLVTTTNIATATPLINTPNINVVVVVSSTPAVVSSTPEIINDDSENTADEEPPIALIAKIYSNESDDWLEIVNASDYDFDLAEAGYRLEKAKTGSDPTLVMRIGDENDGIYPGGTIIKSGESYLIVNDEASPEMIAKADAIAIKDTFSWTEDSYTIYLGTASISSDGDIDIIDKLGYGEAKYFESLPATSLKKGYALERKANINSTLESLMKGGLEEFWPRLFDSNDNSEDFILVPFDEALIASENNNSEEETTNNINLYQAPVGLDSENLTQLWHFDECYGPVAFNELQASGQSPIDFSRPAKWTVGKWGCAASLSFYDQAANATFLESLDINQSTINFYYRNRDDNVGFAIGFYNPEENGRSASLEFSPYYTDVNGLPGPVGRLNDIKWPNDNKWHQVSLVVDRVNGYWALYLDAKEVYRYEYNGIIPTFKYMYINGRTVNKTDFDELSIWNRSLPVSELKTINILGQPFNPYSWPSQQKEAQLIHHWNFDENIGLLTKDNLSQSEIVVDLDQWNMEGKSNSALTIGKKTETKFSETSLINDLSLSFWWRNINSGNEGRLQLSLNDRGNSVMSLTPTIYNTSLGFNGYNTAFIHSENYIPDDNKWHHLVLTYDSYRYLLKFYVDGKEKYQGEYIKLKEGSKIDGLSVIQENGPSAIDELKIWNGVLFPEQVKVEYEAVK